MQTVTNLWTGSFAAVVAAAAIGLARPAPARADCPYPSYIDCLQAGETVDFCKMHQLNCDPSDPGDGSGGSGGGGGGGNHDPDQPDCPYGNYTECLQAGYGVDFCKRHALNCDDGGGEGEGDPCDVLDDETGTGCDGSATWLDLSEPYNVVQSEAMVCPYDSYIECLQAGETVDFCKRHQLNCHPGEPTQAQATVDFNARQCTSKAPCLCGQATGQVTFYGETVIKGDEICLEITSFSYNGPFPGQVNPAIVAELDAIGWEFCMPLECI